MYDKWKFFDFSNIIWNKNMTQEMTAFFLLFYYQHNWSLRFLNNFSKVNTKIIIRTSKIIGSTINDSKDFGEVNVNPRCAEVNKPKIQNS